MFAGSFIARVLCNLAFAYTYENNTTRKEIGSKLKFFLLLFIFGVYQVEETD